MYYLLFRNWFDFQKVKENIIVLVLGSSENFSKLGYPTSKNTHNPDPDSRIHPILITLSSPGKSAVTLL